MAQKGSRYPLNVPKIDNVTKKASSSQLSFYLLKEIAYARAQIFSYKEKIERIRILLKGKGIPEF